MKSPLILIVLVFLLSCSEDGTSPPTITAVSPSQGPTTGGTEVTITGEYSSATQPTVTFGGDACTSMVLVSATQITCNTPAHEAGAVDVVVTNGEGQTGTLSEEFTYLSPQNISIAADGTSITSGGTFSLGLVPENFDAGGLDFSVTNTGQIDLEITSNVTLSGTNSDQFSITSQPDTSIASSSSSTFNIKFLPTSAGPKTTTVTINSNDPDTPSASFTITGHTEWGTSFVDGGGTTGINHNTSQSAVTPCLVILNNKLYAVWRETNGGVQQVRFVVYNGDDSSPSWTLDIGLNKSATRNAMSPHAVVSDGTLYIAWYESNGSKNQIRVLSYNGNDNNPTFFFIDGNPTNGINKDPTRDATEPKLISFNGKLYAAWEETNGTANQVRVAVYNSTLNQRGWSFVDGNGAVGINKDSSKSARGPWLTTFDSKLYGAWYESNGTAQQIRVAVYNGNDSSPSWTFVDGGGTDGINKDTMKNAEEQKLISFNGKLYAYWRETDGSKTQARMKVYNGNDSSPTWSAVDGDNITGLNKDTSEQVYGVYAYVFRNKLYYSWEESSGAVYQIRNIVYNGNDSSTAWAFVDGNGSTGLNYDTAKSAYKPNFIEFNGKLYLAWHEKTGGVNQIRVSVANQ